MFYALRHIMLVSIRKNTKKIHGDLQYRDIILEACITHFTSHELLKKQFASSTPARNFWHSKDKKFINQSLKAGLKALRNIMNDPLKINVLLPLQIW